MRWSRHGRVLAADPGREFAFVTEEGGRESAIWRYRIEPVAGGTQVTESDQVRWIPASARIIDVPTNRHRELREAMSHTLRRLQAAAETPARPPGPLVLGSDRPPAQPPVPILPALPQAASHPATHRKEHLPLRHHT